MALENDGFRPGRVFMSWHRRAALAALALWTVGSLGGCGDATSAEAESASSAVPPEIVLQLTAIEAATNSRSLSDLAPLFDERASIQAVGLLGYGSRSQYLESIGAVEQTIPFKFGESVLVSERPGKIRTVSEVIRRFGEEIVVERVSHEWVRQGDRWVVKDQSFPDWSPLVGAWWREDVDAKVELRLMPSGIFEMVDGSGVVVRKGVFATGTDEATFTPDALGSGATSERPIDASFRFEFDGSLEVTIVSGSENAGIPSLGGVWKRRSMK